MDVCTSLVTNLNKDGLERKQRRLITQVELLGNVIRNLYAKLILKSTFLTHGKV